MRSENKNVVRNCPCLRPYICLSVIYGLLTRNPAVARKDELQSIQFLLQH